MSVSHVRKFPEFTKLEIPEKQRTIHLKEKTIFRDLLNEKRTLADCDRPAQKGDYIRIDVLRSSGAEEKLSVELGAKAFLEFNEILPGCRAGDVIKTKVMDHDTVITVMSVRHTVEYPLTDNNIATLGIENISSLKDYRRDYIRKHGRELGCRVFETLQHRLMDELMALSDIQIDENEFQHYHEEQWKMLEMIAGDVEARLMAGYGDYGKKTPEECHRLFREDNRRMFTFYVFAKDLAEKNGDKPTEEDTAQALMYYSMIYDIPEEKIRSDDRLEDAMRSFYLSYGIRQLRDYYLSIVTICAEDLEPISCNSKD